MIGKKVGFLIARRVVLALILGVLLFLIALAGITGSGRRDGAFPVIFGAAPAGGKEAGGEGIFTAAENITDTEKGGFPAK